MAHPLRLGVLEALRHGPKNVTELFRELGSSQSTTQQRLQILVDQGLVLGRKEGTVKPCSLRNREVLTMLESLRRHLHLNLAGRALGPAVRRATGKEGGA